MGADITICAIARDELHGVLEWIAYYKALGADQILIFDNDSSDGTERLLAALGKQGEIIHIPWPRSEHDRPQTEAYNHALGIAATEWMAFFDCDEFLVLKAHHSLRDYISDAPDDAGAIGINWQVFGDGGHASYAPLPVTERFTLGSPADAPVNLAFKSLVRCHDVRTQSIHEGRLSSGRYVTGSFDALQRKSIGTSVAVDHRLAVLNHYAVKSREEWQRKLTRGHANRSQKGRRRAGALQSVLEELNDNSFRYDDIVPFLAGMRREAFRLRDLVRASGLEFPVWPFVDERIE